MSSHPAPRAEPENGAAAGMATADRAVARRILSALLVSATLHGLVFSALALSGGSKRATATLQSSAGALTLRMGVASPIAEQVAMPDPQAGRSAAASGAQADAQAFTGQDIDFGNPRDLPGLFDIFSTSLDLTWHDASALDVRAEPMIDMDFDALPVEPTESAMVYLEVFIDEFGLTDRVDVVRAVPPGRYEGAVRDAFIQARWSPAIKDGRFVRSRKLIEVCVGACQLPVDQTAGALAERGKP